MVGRIVRLLTISSLLIAALSAQGGRPLEITFHLPSGHSEEAFLAYEHHEPGGGQIHAGASLPPDHPFVEIPAASDRFKAQLWIPGCKMQRFDVPVDKSDITLQLVCDPLSTVPFRGRVTGVDVGDSARISASYMSMDLCMWLSGCDLKKRCGGSCLGWQFNLIASAAVSSNGTFKIDLPNFAADEIGSEADIDFHISGVKERVLLRPEPATGIQTKTLSIGVAPSYPSEVTFRAVPLNDLSSLTE
jgi:hypothetical protein